jgi:hypothetical protein
MRLNPLPFVFAPGVGVMGYLADGWPGAGYALLGWSAIVIAGTALHSWRHKFHPDVEVDADEHFSWPGVN